MKNKGYIIAAIVGVLVVATVAIWFNRPSGSTDEQVVRVAAGAPAFCQGVASMPKGLSDAVGNAAGGVASGDDREVIADAVSQLREASNDKSAGRELAAQFADVADLLDKLAKNQTLSANEATSLAKTLQDMDKAVKKACSAN